MKLLIIEDDINLANTLARRFVKQGFECELAHSSKQALEKLAILEALLIIILLMRTKCVHLNHDLNNNHYKMGSKK